MLLTILMLIGAVPFIRKGGRDLPGELGFGMAFSLAFLLGGGYFLALSHLWNLTVFLPVVLLVFAIIHTWGRKCFWQKKAEGWKNAIETAARNNKLDLPDSTIYFLILATAFLFLWYLSCGKDLPCGWDPAFHALLAGKILKEGVLSSSWLPFENISMNYPQGSHVLIALTAKYGSLCKFLPEGLSAVPEAQKLLMFALVLPSALLIWGISQKVFNSFSCGFFAFLTYIFLGNLGSYSSFWSWGGYPTAVGFFFFSALAYFALSCQNMEKKDYFYCAVLWGSFGLCHHMSVVIVAFILFIYTLLCVFARKDDLWRIWKTLVLPGFYACILYLPGIIFQIRSAGSTQHSEVFRFDDEPPFTFLKILENGSIPLAAGIFTLLLIFLFRKKISFKAEKQFLLVWALASFGGFLFLDVVFRYCIALPFYGKSFSLFVPSRVFTMAMLPFSILTGFLLYRILRHKSIRKIKYPAILFTLLAVCYGCMNFYTRSTLENSSMPVQILAKSVAEKLPENAYVIVDPSRIRQTHWLPFLLWKPCITNPIPSSEDRRSVRKGLELFLYTPWDKMDLPAIRKYLKERGDQKAFWIIAGEDGKVRKVFQYPAD